MYRLHFDASENCGCRRFQAVFVLTHCLATRLDHQFAGGDPYHQDFSGEERSPADISICQVAQLPSVLRSTSPCF